MSNFVLGVNVGAWLGVCAYMAGRLYARWKDGTP